MSNTRKLPKKTTSAKQWKKNHDTLELPSGNVVRAKNPGFMELVHKGVVPNSLMSIVMDSIKKGQEPKPEEILSDNVEMDDMFEMMSQAVIAVCMDPQVLPVPVWEEEDVRAEQCRLEDVGQVAEKKRDPDELYIDEMSEEDKMFIWSWVTGGTTDLEQFRGERADLLARIPGQPAVESATE